MLLTIDKASKHSIYIQIYNQIKVLVEQGVIQSGEKLPSSRSLAKTLGVNRSSIIKAYDELLMHGYIESSPGSYTKVRNRLPIHKKKEIYFEENAYSALEYNDDLGLPYDLMMPYLEHAKQIEQGKINFLQLSPDTRLLDSAAIKSCMKKTLNTTFPGPFEFAHARGFPPLRDEIAKQMKLHGVYAQDQNILVTNGSLQSLQLLFQVFSQPGDFIVIERPSYSIIYMFVKIFKLKPIEVPINNEGIDLEQFSLIMANNKVKFIYTMSTYQNPTGYSMTGKVRERFIDICSTYDCLVIEDSIEEEMCYSGKAYLPVKTIDKREQVIYLGTYSKIMAPGLRIGWIIASKDCIKKLTVVKSIFEISSASISQIFLYNFINKGSFEIHMRKTIRVFKMRMKIAIGAIKKYFPLGKYEWTEPTGGYMIWIKLLTKKIDNIELHFSKFGVLVHNGQYFFLESQPNNYIRICIAQVDEIEIEDGIRRIGDAILKLN